jgi:hypothetical protein
MLEPVTGKLRKFCKDICRLYKARKTENSGNYYNHGFKRCIECGIFLECESMGCPCCDHVLNARPHNNGSEAKLLQSL